MTVIEAIYDMDIRQLDNYLSIDGSLLNKLEAIELAAEIADIQYDIINYIKNEETR